MTTPHDPTMSHEALDAVIAAYMLAVEAGQPVKWSGLMKLTWPTSPMNTNRSAAPIAICLPFGDHVAPAIDWF